MKNALSDSSKIYEWTLKIEKSSETNEHINIGIASYPYSKEIGKCCNAQYDHSFVSNHYFIVIIQLKQHFMIDFEIIKGPCF